jgi:hypothetical protein
MGVNLDLLTTPLLLNQCGEVFEPENAWPDAPGRIFLTVLQMIRGIVIQIGMDAEPGPAPLWMRQKLTAGGDWGAWQNVDLIGGAPAPPA